MRAVSQSLDEKLQVHQNTLLHHLLHKLQAANELVDGIIGKPQPQGRPSVNDLARKQGVLRRIKYALSLKEHLNNTVLDLKKWHEMFDPSWFLIVRVPNRDIDKHLTDQRVKCSSSVLTLKRMRDVFKEDNKNQPRDKPFEVFVPSHHLVDDREPIAFSTSWVSRESQTNRRVLVDRIQPPQNADLEAIRRDVSSLARVLSRPATSSFGLLPCRGVIALPEAQTPPNSEVQQHGTSVTSGQPRWSRFEFEFVFAIPGDIRQPRTLRAILIDADSSHSLNERLELAKQAINSVMFVHSAKFVHKNIRPETIVVFKKGNEALGPSFLVGFERFRSASSATYLLGDSSWERNMYRHPSRQGVRPEASYKMQHDIYSLGVCLLELGLWTSFVASTGTFDASASVWASLNLPQRLSACSSDYDKGVEMKLALAQLAKDQLPRRMGTKYTDIVVSCLTCLDDENSAFGEEAAADANVNDVDGIGIGIRFIEKVRSSPLSNTANYLL